MPNRYCDAKLKSYVKLYFSVDGQRYTSECFCKPKIGTVGMELQKYNNENDDWEDITQSSVIKTRQYIQDHILGCSFDLFKTAIVVSASDCMNFYENMGKQAKRNFVENIFNLNCFGIMFADIKSNLNAIKKELTYTNNEIIKSSQRLDTLKIKFEEYDNKLMEDLSALKNDMLSKYNDLKQYQAQINSFSSELTQYDTLSEQYKLAKENIKKLNKAYKQVETEILEINSDIKTINKVLKEISKLKEGLCETCTELFNSRYSFDEKTQRIDELTQVLNTKQQALSKLETAIETYSENEETLKIQISDLDNKKNKEEQLTYKVNLLTNEIKKLKTDYDKLTQNQSNPFQELMCKTETELESLKVQMIKYVKDSKHLELLRDACSENGVKRFIIKDIVKLLNSLIQKYLNEIRSRIFSIF